MAHDDLSPTDRRTFLQAGALVTASAASLGADASTQDAAPALPATLPKRPLGKTGLQISLLDIGTGKGRGVGRLLRYAYSQGIRAFDTSGQESGTGPGQESGTGPILAVQGVSAGGRRKRF
jgi:hypothetical protein